MVTQFEHYNKTFHQKLEYSQYIACLALSGGIRGLSREKLYQELGLESLQRRGCTGNFAYFLRFLKKINQFTFLI